MSDAEIEYTLKGIRAILKRHHERTWAREFAYLVKDFAAIQESANDNSKLEVLERIRGIFGGMGSFNDLSIDHRAGHFIKPEQVRAVNAELDRLSNQLFMFVEEEISLLSRNERDE